MAALAPAPDEEEKPLRTAGSLLLPALCDHASAEATW